MYIELKLTKIKNNMEIINKPANYYNSLEVNLNAKKFTINYYHSVSNCKLTVIENVLNAYHGLANNRKPEENLDELFIAFLEKVKSLMPGRNILIHITDKKLAELITQKMKHLYSINVPTGYNGGDQYHILLSNCAHAREKYNYQIVDDKSKIDIEQVLNIITKSFETTINRQKRLDIIKEELIKIIK